MKPITIGMVFLILGVYLFLCLRMKKPYAAMWRGAYKIMLMAIIFVLTLVDQEYIRIGTLSFGLRISVVLLSGFELIDAIEEQISLHKAAK